MINLINQIEQNKANIDSTLFYLNEEKELQKLNAEIDREYPQTVLDALEKEDSEYVESKKKDIHAQDIVFGCYFDGTLDLKESYKKIDFEKPQKELPKVGEKNYLLEKLEKFNTKPEGYYQEFEIYEENPEPVYLLEKRKDPEFDINTAIIQRPKEGIFSRIGNYMASKFQTEKETEYLQCAPVKERILPLEDIKVIKRPSPEDVLKMLDESDNF